MEDHVHGQLQQHLILHHVLQDHTRFSILREVIFVGPTKQRD